MKELVAYWRDRDDWRKQDRLLNSFDQFTTNIDGLSVHRPQSFVDDVRAFFRDLR